MRAILRSRLVRWSSVPILCGAAFALATPAHATVTWTATFEKNKSGDVCSSAAADAEFKPGINETKGTRVNAQVLGVAAYTGSLGCQITVHPDDTFGQYNQDRVDIQHPSTLTGEGKDSWVSGHYFMPADAMMRNEIGFYETKVSSSNVIDFWVAPKTGGGTTLSFGVGFLGATVLWTGDFAVGKWHQIAVHVKWSQSATTGSVDFWLDGVQTVTAHKFKTKPDGNDLFFQTGLHRILPMNFTDVIYFDDFIEADTQAEAQIAAATQPSDGGAPVDAAGTGAAGSAGGAGTTGAAGSSTSGAAGTSAGAAGSSASGSAGTSASGAAGSSASGSAGTSASGAAGRTATGAAGTSTTGAAGTRASSSGCATAPNGGPVTPLVSGLALLGLAIARRRRR
jgi:MYXO-CTERM domain-containing protein